MTNYRNMNIGHDAEGAVDQQVTQDGLVVFPHIGYLQAIRWVEGVIQSGDTYEEEEKGKVYAVQTYEEFVSSLEADRLFDAGESK